MSKLFRTAVIAVSALFTISAFASPDDTGTIRGHTTPHTQIVVIADGGGGITGVMSDAEGNFEASNLKPGHYEVARKSSSASEAGAPVIAGRVTTVILPKS